MYTIVVGIHSGLEGSRAWLVRDAIKYIFCLEGMMSSQLLMWLFLKEATQKATFWLYCQQSVYTQPRSWLPVKKSQLKRFPLIWLVLKKRITRWSGPFHE